MQLSIFVVNQMRSAAEIKGKLGFLDSHWLWLQQWSTFCILHQKIKKYCDMFSQPLIGTHWDLLICILWLIFSLVYTVQHKTQRKECKDFLHSAIQYCFNVIYQRSKFLFQDAHKILHFLICFGQTLYFVLVIWKTLEEVSEKCRTIEQVCRFPRLTEWTSNLAICSTMYARSFNVLSIAKSHESSLQVPGAPTTYCLVMWWMVGLRVTQAN